MFMEFEFQFFANNILPYLLAMCLGAKQTNNQVFCVTTVLATLPKTGTSNL